MTIAEALKSVTATPTTLVRPLSWVGSGRAVGTRDGDLADFSYYCGDALEPHPFDASNVDPLDAAVTWESVHPTTLASESWGDRYDQ